MFGASRIKHLVKRGTNSLGYDVAKLHSIEQAAWIADLKIATVLDIGANIGQFATSTRKLLPEAQIYAFEPIDECFATLNERMRGDAFFHSFPYAVGSENGSATLHRNEFSPSSSLLSMSDAHADEFPWTAKASETVIGVRTLDSVVSNLDFVQPLLVKIDVQGFELHVVEGGRETLRQAEVVIMEVAFAELYKGQPSFDDLYSEMHGIGLSFCGVWDQLHSSSNDAPLSCNALFVRQG